MQKDLFIKKLLDAAVAAGIAQAEVYYQSAEALKAMTRNGEIEDYAVNTTGGLSLRGLVNGKMAMAFTEALDEDAIPMLIENVVQSAALIEDEDEQFIFAGSPKYETVDATGDLGSPADRIQLAIALEKEALCLDERVKSLSYCMLQTARESVQIVNTHGLNLTHSGDYAVAYVAAIAREGEKVTNSGAMRIVQNLSDISAAEMGKEAVAESVFQLSAAPCDSGEMPVIIRNTAMADFLDTFSGIFSADAAQKGMSLLKGKEGEAVAAPCLTVVDDPLLRGGIATRAFDGEGVATYTKNVINEGTLTTLLHNLKTAKKAGCASTGNAVRAGYKGAVGVSCSNLYIAPGELDLAALEKKMGTGLVITEMEGMHSGADAISGDFSLLSRGYLVENGVRGRAVEQITAAGNFFQLMKDIQAVGSDLRPTGNVAAPSVLIGKMAITGK